MRLLQQQREPTSRRKSIIVAKKNVVFESIVFSLLKSHRCTLLVECIVALIDHYFLCPSLNPYAPLLTLLGTSITSSSISVVNITMAYRMSRSYPKMCFLVPKVKFRSN